MKLKYRLEKWEKALVFQVLEMDERFRSDNSMCVCNCFVSKNGVKVYSADFPVIDNDVFLMGYSWSEDNNVSSFDFDSNKERDEHFDRIQEAIEDWANNWKGWGDKENYTEVDNAYINSDGESSGVYSITSYGKKRIEFTLKEYPLSLFFQVHYLDESFDGRFMPDDTFDVTTANAAHLCEYGRLVIEVDSNSVPYLLRCESEKKLDNIKRKTLDALKQWAAEFFKPEPAKIKQNDDGMYEV